MRPRMAWSEHLTVVEDAEYPKVKLVEGTLQYNPVSGTLENSAGEALGDVTMVTAQLRDALMPMEKMHPTATTTGPGRALLAVGSKKRIAGSKEEQKEGKTISGYVDKPSGVCSQCFSNKEKMDDYQDCSLIYGEQCQNLHRKNNVKEDYPVVSSKADCAKEALANGWNTNKLCQLTCRCVEDSQFEKRKLGMEKEEKADVAMSKRLHYTQEEKDEKFKVKQVLQYDSQANQKAAESRSTAVDDTLYASPKKTILELSQQIKQWDEKYEFKIEKAQKSSGFDMMNMVGEAFLKMMSGVWNKVMSLLGKKKKYKTDISAMTFNATLQREKVLRSQLVAASEVGVMVARLTLKSEYSQNLIVTVTIVPTTTVTITRFGGSLRIVF